jgi:DNA-binding PadR family transcriptional regulator
MIGLWKVAAANGRRRGFITIYILHSLSKKPKSGYDLISEIKCRCGDRWAPSKGTLYPLLGQLEEEGLIAVKDVGKRSKNVFEITPKGKKALSELRKKREMMRERFAHFRNLLSDVMGEGDREMFDLLFKIKEKSLTLPKGKKGEASNVLAKCLESLEKIGD